MESEWSSPTKSSSGSGVTGYSPGDLPSRRPRRAMISPGGRLEVTISTTPNEMMSVAVNMEQNGWSLGECLELLGFLSPSLPPRVVGWGRQATNDTQASSTAARGEEGPTVV